ncbi:MAG TPA: ROK family protein [Amaricoccus sp.]|nr:ROK family protein [Amaricoccus sp.]
MILCFDIGGSTMKGGRARSVADIEVLERVPTPARDFDAFAAVLARAIAECPEPPRALAAAIPGVIEPGSGLGVVANIPCISGIPVRERLEAALGLPVILANDADCFALAEMAAGAGRGHSVVFGIILGTGVGGGLVIEGRLVNAAGGFAGEWGHGPVAARIAGTPAVELPRFACGCGLAGCLDATISARGMERLHLHLHGRAATSLAIVAGWEAAEPEAARTVAVWLEIAAAPLAMLVNATAADILPVGGGLGGSATLMAALDAEVRRLTLRRFDRPLVVPALCRVEPGLVGAAWLGFAEKKLHHPANPRESG